MAAELLKRRFDVYMTLVDDQGIDCVVRLDKRRYVDIQIKARSLQAKHWNRFAKLRFEPRPNLFFILVLENTDRLWVIPSLDLAKLSHENRDGKNKGCRTVDLPKVAKGLRHDRFAAFESDAGFELLRRCGKKKGPAPEKVPALSRGSLSG